MSLLAAVAALLLAAASGLPPPDPIPAAVGSDAPADKAHPAQMLPVALPSHGVKINAVLYTAAGPGLHPAVLLLHGLPGNEQNLDLAQAIRRDGWSVLTVHYRGSWGSPGGFSFAHCAEDAEAAAEWLRSPTGGGALGVDPSRIVVIGHSMGGWAAALTLEHDPAVMAGGLISAANVGVTLGKLPRPALVGAIDANIGASAGLHALAGTSPEALADEALRNAETFDILLSAKSIGQRPLLVVTSDDGLAGSSLPLGSAVQALDGGEVTFVHLPTDHSYSDQRIALEASVLRWLENLPGAPPGL